MKKCLLALAAALLVSISADACIAANARTEYMTMFVSASAVDNSNFAFSENSLGGKGVVGFGTFKGYMTFGATFEMYGKVWTNSNKPIVGVKDWRAGLQVGFDPFASIDRESKVVFRLMGEVGYSSVCRSAYNGYGARLEFGGRRCQLFIQDMAHFDYYNGTYQWSNRAEIGLQVKFDVGKGKVYCNRR